MSRAKKNRMKVWIPLLVVVFAVVVITFFMLHDLKGKVNKIDNAENTKQNENVVEDDDNEIVENDTISNEVVNEVVEDNQTNTTNNTTNTAKTNSSTSVNSTNETTSVASSSGTSTPAVTDKKQKAIELVKKEWGEDNTVNFSFEYINENGEYIVAVRRNSSATTEFYYRVDLDTETVELD